MSTLTDKAQALLNDRLASLTGIEQAQQRVQAARAELDAAQADLARTYDTAIGAGWTPAELRTLGVDEPAKRRPGRPRRTPTAGRKNSTRTTSAAHEVDGSTIDDDGARGDAAAGGSDA